ncbi:MAG: hypothetical protein EZS28_018273 [Streblomastix strix]|uniref:B30.2/SPRY domain-containing protein n=1 Tax=Streblomastix strix TaxID=222440 RepID=A0A5J4VV82_9EUKA|nr:MAG: hypothetical protein EZS28_018273 [Streblomastix strix]
MKNPDPESVIFEQVDGILSKVKLNRTCERTIEIFPVITDGIYLFEIIYQNLTGFSQGPGIMKESLNIINDMNPCDVKSVVCFNACDGFIYYKGQVDQGNSEYSNNQKIGLELDKGKGTLHFFIDGVQQPVFVRGINEPVKFYKLLAPITHTLPDEKAVDW